MTTLRSVTRTTSVLTFIQLWSLYRATEKRDPENMEELADALGRHRASLYRWRQDYREVFPEFDTPGELLDAIGATGPLNVRALGKVTVPPAPPRANERSASE
jgi:hypothetical protein